MANNRMYLRCTVCGEEFFLGKRQNDGYYVSDRYDAIDRLNAFYDKHKHGHDFDQDCFDIVYEVEQEK